MSSTCVPSHDHPHRDSVSAGGEFDMKRFSMLKRPWFWRAERRPAHGSHEEGVKGAMKKASIVSSAPVVAPQPAKDAEQKDLRLGASAIAESVRALDSPLAEHAEQKPPVSALPLDDSDVELEVKSQHENSDDDDGYDSDVPLSSEEEHEEVEALTASLKAPSAAAAQRLGRSPAAAAAATAVAQACSAPPRYPARAPKKSKKAVRHVQPTG